MGQDSGSGGVGGGGLAGHGRRRRRGLNAGGREGIGLPLAGPSPMIDIDPRLDSGVDLPLSGASGLPGQLELPNPLGPSPIGSTSQSFTQQNLSDLFERILGRRQRGPVSAPLVGGGGGKG